MARGRKSIPAAKQKARGNPSRRKPKKPVVSRGCVGAPPPFISKEAREAWRWLRPKLEAMKILTDADEVAFAALCESVGEWQKYRKMLNEEGGRIKPHPTKKGAFLYNPVGFVDKIEKRMLALLVEFGLTPRSRSGVMAAGPEEEASPFADFEVIQGGKR